MPRLKRLVRWLEPFTGCFGHVAQLVSFGAYVTGLFSDSPRKSMEAMLARVTDPPRYQAFQHFITHSPWNADRVWRQLLAVLPARRGVLLLDDTGFPKQGTHSVAVARQYSGTLGKIGNCQVAVTAALWAAGKAWLVGAAIYVPQAWFEDRARCARVRLPPKTRFQEKWRLALMLLRRIRAAGISVTAVVADAGYGDVTVFRTALHRLQLVYALGISSTTAVFRGTPPLQPPPPSHGPRPTRDAPQSGTGREGDHRGGARPRAARHAVDTDPVAQRQPAAARGRLRRVPRHARPRLAAPPPGPRGVVALRTPGGRQTRREVLPDQSAAPDVARPLGRSRASSLGDRAAVLGHEDRTRHRPLRRPVVPGLATPRRDQCGGLRLPAARARAGSVGPHLPADPRHRPRDFYRLVLCGSSAVPRLDSARPRILAPPTHLSPGATRAVPRGVRRRTDSHASPTPASATPRCVAASPSIGILSGTRPAPHVTHERSRVRAGASDRVVLRQTPTNLSACTLRKNQPGADGHDRGRDLFSTLIRC
ncbi:MAG: IS701 family transposase [Spirochaetes bacterium]|nr:IS701 family transposase [Spirochaetota bacterium]